VLAEQQISVGDTAIVTVGIGVFIHDEVQEVGHKKVKVRNRWFDLSIVQTEEEIERIKKLVDAANKRKAALVPRRAALEVAIAARLKREREEAEFLFAASFAQFTLMRQASALFQCGKEFETILPRSTGKGAVEHATPDQIAEWEDVLCRRGLSMDRGASWRPTWIDVSTPTRPNRGYESEDYNEALGNLSMPRIKPHARFAPYPRVLGSLAYTEETQRKRRERKGKIMTHARLNPDQICAKNCWIGSENKGVTCTCKCGGQFHGIGFNPLTGEDY